MSRLCCTICLLAAAPPSTNEDQEWSCVFTAGKSFRNEVCLQKHPTLLCLHYTNRFHRFHPDPNRGVLTLVMHMHVRAQTQWPAPTLGIRKIYAAIPCEVVMHFECLMLVYVCVCVLIQNKNKHLQVISQWSQSLCSWEKSLSLIPAQSVIVIWTWANNIVLPDSHCGILQPLTQHYQFCSISFYYPVLHVGGTARLGGRWRGDMWLNPTAVEADGLFAARLK